MLVLKENEVCPHANNCSYNVDNSCQGANGNRSNKFTCEYASLTEVYATGETRNRMDKTGRMKVIMEQN